MNYLEYYEKCKENYSGNTIDLKSLDELTILTGNLKGKQLGDVKSIYNFSYNKINKKEDLFDINHENIIKVNNFEDCDNISDLGNYFGDYLEKNYYGCNTIIEAVLIYQSLPNKVEQSSWIWHYDDNVNEQIKLIIYLNDVNKNTGAIQFLLKDDEGKKIKTSRLSPKINLKQVYYHSRIDNNSLLKFVSEGYKPTSLTGIAGTHCLFDPNCIHKATTPTEMPYRLCLVYNFRPYHKPVENRVTKKFTRSWSNLGHIKSYSTSVKT